VNRHLQEAQAGYAIGAAFHRAFDLVLYYSGGKAKDLQSQPISAALLAKGASMKITVDRTKCEGYGKCMQVAAKVFKFDEKFICEVIDPKADSDERILLAAKVCPTKAIILEEEDTGKRIFPLT